MKSITKLLTGAFCVCLLAVGLTACEKHTHSYTEEVTAPTCTKQGYTTHTCSCGHSYVDTYVDELGHDFKHYLSDNNATCEEDGTKTAVCNRKNCSQINTIVDEHSALGHEFKYYFSDDNATCEEDGTETAICSNAGCYKINTRTNELSAGHIFVNYLSNDNATFEQNCTETAVCNRVDCRETNTRDIENTMLDASLYFTVTGNTKTGYTIKGLTDYGKEHCTELVLPSKIKGVEVTTIGHWAFEDCVKLTNIVIPDGVLTIETAAFRGCIGLEEIVIPDSVTTIGMEAFNGCSSLTKIVIPDDVGIIESRLFYNCSGLTNVRIGDSVTTIGVEAFGGCSNLTKMIIPDGVTVIEEEAFEACSGLTSLMFGNGITTIGRAAFDGCGNLTSVYIENMETWFNISFAGRTSNPLIWAKNFLINNSLVTALYPPNTVTEIKSSVFCGYSNLRNFIIPDGVTLIGVSAFSECGITEIVIPESVTTIEGGAFEYCYGLTSIKFNGTMAQWKKVSKGYYWNYRVPATEVVCADGTVAL